MIKFEVLMGKPACSSCDVDNRVSEIFWKRKSLLFPKVQPELDN
jgi:hypothetical protein